MALVVSRFLAGPMLLGAALTYQRRDWLIGLLVFVLADVFDSVLARRLRVVTAQLRTADSTADTSFYLCVALAVWLLHRALLAPFTIPLLTVLALLAVNWVMAMVKFQRALSFHAYSSRLWGASLFAASASILGHLEGFAMVMILPYWAHDVSGIPEALRLREAMKAAP